MATEIPTPAELTQIGQAQLRALLDPQGTGAVDLQAGSRNDIMMSVLTAMMTRLIVHTAERTAARSLQSAVTDDLAVLGSDIYNDAEKPAAAATGTVYLKRPTSSLPTPFGATVIPNGSRFTVPATATQPAVVYFASQDVPVAAGAANQTVAVPVTCAQTGVIGNLGAQLQMVTSIQDTLPDTGWVLYVPAANDPVLQAQGASFPNSNGALPNVLAGGAEPESDDQFRARLKQGAFSDSQKRGTKVALQTGALQVPGIQYVNIVEPGDGTALVFCGDSGYQLSSQLQSAVQTQLESWRAFGIPALVRAYNVITVFPTLTLYMSRPLVNYNVPLIQQNAIAAVTAYFLNRPRPDEFFGPLIGGAASVSSPEIQDWALTVTVSSGTNPDSTGSVRRVADANAGATIQLARYVVNNTSMQVNVLPPLTQ